MKVLVSTERPEVFKAKVSVSSCIIRCEDKILFIRNAGAWKGKWSLPGGIAEGDESPMQTLIREVSEELDLQISGQRFLRRLFLTNPSYGDYEINYFEVLFNTKPDIRLSDEHLESGWFSCEDYSKLDLIPGVKDSLQMVIYE